MGPQDWDGNTPASRPLARTMHLAFAIDDAARHPDSWTCRSSGLREYARTAAGRRATRATGRIGSRRSPSTSETTNVNASSSGNGGAARIPWDVIGSRDSGLGFQTQQHGNGEPVAGRRNGAPPAAPRSGGSPCGLKDGQLALRGSRRCAQGHGITQASLNTEVRDVAAEAVAAMLHVEDEPGIVIVEPHFEPRALGGRGDLATRSASLVHRATCRSGAPTRRPDCGCERSRGDRGLRSDLVKAMPRPLPRRTSS